MSYAPIDLGCYHISKWLYPIQTDTADILLHVRYLLGFILTGDGILPFSMVMHVLRAILIVIVLLLHLSVISFGPVLPMHHAHTSEEHHHTHYDYHDSGNNFASLIAHSALPLQSPIG